MLSLAGHGDIVASGLTLDRLEGNIAGLGNLDLGHLGWRAEHRRRRWRQGAGLASEEVEVSIAGSGEVEVRAQSRLPIEIAGRCGHWGSRLTSGSQGSGRVSRLEKLIPSSQQ